MAKRTIASITTLLLLFLLAVPAFAADSGAAHTVTVQYVDPNGNPIHEPDVYAYEAGSLYDVTAIAIDGYAFDSAEGETSGILTADATITLVYVPMETAGADIPAVDPPYDDIPDEDPPLSDDPSLSGYFTITVCYRDIDGNVIREAETTRQRGASLYEVTAPALDNYGFVEAMGETSGILTEDVTVELVYESQASLPDGQVPLANAPTDNAPPTGDTAVPAIGLVLAAVSGGALVLLRRRTSL